MKKNLKVNLIWFGLIIGLFLILKGLELSGIMNLYYIQILMGIGISILMGLGTNLVLGFSGQFTLGQAGFMAIGAYSSAIITGMMPTYDGFYLSMVVGVIIAAIVALIFGLPTLRLKGDYLAIATLGMAEIIRIIIVNGGELTNGAAGLTGILPYTSWPVIYFFVVIITIWCLISYVQQLDVKQSLFVKMKLLLSQWVLMSQNEGSYLCYWCHDFSDCWLTLCQLHRYSRAKRFHHHEIN